MTTTITKPTETLVAQRHRTSTRQGPQQPVASLRPTLRRLLVAMLALQVASGSGGAQQAELHEQASVAPGQPMGVAEAGGSPLADSAAAMVAEDLLAAESSQSPDGDPHKAFTSAQLLRQVS